MKISKQILLSMLCLGIESLMFGMADGTKGMPRSDKKRTHKTIINHKRKAVQEIERLFKNLEDQCPVCGPAQQQHLKRIAGEVHAKVTESCNYARRAIQQNCMPCDA